MLWIVGASGIASSALQRACKSRGIPYVASSSKECDISSKSALENFASKHSISAIINCGAYTAVDAAEQNKKRAFEINLQGAGFLAELAKRFGIKLVHFSTDYVFDGKSHTPYRELDTPHPLSVYGESKYEGELLVRQILPESLIIRTSWVFGKEGHNFVKTLIRAMREKEEIHLVVDQISRPTYAEDLASITFDLMNEKGIYHVANNHAVSRYEYGKEVYEILTSLGVPLKCTSLNKAHSSDFPTPARRPAYSVLSTLKAEKQLCYSIRDHREALREYIVDLMEKE